MGTLVEQLGNMQAGQLIRAEDWNALVAAVDRVETDLGQRLDALTTTVNEGLATAAERIDALKEWRAQVEPMLARYVQVTMLTSKSSFAIGEQAEIRAQVTDLFGKPLSLTDAADRPWVDFITTWGRLRAAPGFTTIGDADDRSVSVQVDATGTARALLRSDHVAGFSAADDAEIHAVLQTVTPGGGKVVDHILAAPNPESAKQAGAFKHLSQAYEREDARAMQRFADAYFFSKPERFVPDDIVGDNFRFRWRDYRATVLAVVKNDVDAQTPDHGRGSSSLQVTFRDWISPWVLIDYVPDTIELKQELKDRFEGKITPDYDRVKDQLVEEIKKVTKARGILGRQRHYKAANEALAELAPADAPEFLGPLKQALGHAISVQQSVLGVQAAVAGLASLEAPFEAISATALEPKTAAVGIEKNVGELRSDFGKLQGGVDDVKNALAAADSRIATLNGRLDSALATGGDVALLRSMVNDVQTKVSVLRDLDPTAVRKGLTELDGLNTRIARLESNR